ncbi:MAG: D-isomer specific 2-hydroxyacid dehydrogenase family protein [Acidimicrobiales bacterium]|nr:D-isomer specific 2-hydroxyacid dehydrogenase family protein [Acidimicrobiales bacterium]
MSAPKVAVAPRSGRYESLVAAVEQGGGVVVDPTEADALVWADAARPDLLPDVLASAPRLRWVQLPFAGIENFVDLLDRERTWTCGKGVYAPPVAEHALAMTLAGLRHLVGYGRATRWEGPAGQNLLGAEVVILGGGEITRVLLGLLDPFGCTTTVVRNRDEAVPGATRTVGPDRLPDVLPGADVVVLALALTPETTGIIGAAELELMADHAWLVNVARGRHVVTDELVAALSEGAIGGAGLDVTDPEPLPSEHPLWSLPNVLITPHVGNTPEMGVPLLAARVTENVRRFAAGDELLGVVDIDLGY